jgi:hypothetical protein
MTAAPDREALAAAHALTSAVCYHAPRELVNQLLKEAAAKGNGYEYALAAAHVCLRNLMDRVEARDPGFRDRFLSAIGYAFASPDDDTTE